MAFSSLHPVLRTAEEQEELCEAERQKGRSTRGSERENEREQSVRPPADENGVMSPPLRVLTQGK